MLHQPSAVPLGTWWRTWKNTLHRNSYPSLPVTWKAASLFNEVVSTWHHPPPLQKSSHHVGRGKSSGNTFSETFSSKGHPHPNIQVEWILPMLIFQDWWLLSTFWIFFIIPNWPLFFFFLELPTKLFLKKNSRPKIFWAGHNFAKLARIFQVFRSQAHSDEKSVRWAQAELDKWRRVWKPRWVGGWGVAGSSHQLPVMFGYILTIIGSSQSIAIYLQQFF